MNRAWPWLSWSASLIALLALAFFIVIWSAGASGQAGSEAPQQTTHELAQRAGDVAHNTLTIQLVTLVSVFAAFGTAVRVWTLQQATTRRLEERADAAERRIEGFMPSGELARLLASLAEDGARLEGKFDRFSEQFIDHLSRTASK